MSSVVKVYLLAALLSAGVWFPAAASAQDIPALSSDFLAQGKVIELTIPPSLDGNSFLVAWGSTAPPYTKMFRARAGTHSYEMRDDPRWQGHIAVMGTTLRSLASGGIKSPAFSDEIDMFLAPERIGLGTVNFMLGHTLLGWTWNTCLLVILILSALCFAVFRKSSPGLSLVLGFFVAWAMMDLRTIYDHFMIVSKTDVAHQGMYGVTDLKVFTDRASDLIGGSTWSRELLDPISDTFVRYSFAEHRYVPAEAQESPDFLVTRDPKQGQVVWEYGGYYLIKEGQR